MADPARQADLFAPPDEAALGPELSVSELLQWNVRAPGAAASLEETDDEAPLEVHEPDRSVALFGLDLFGEPVNQRLDSTLARRFLLPPFSVLNAREGWWQERKRAWLSLGIRSEVGRGIKASGCYSGRTAEGSAAAEIVYGRPPAPGGSLMPAMGGQRTREALEAGEGFLRGDGAGRALEPGAEEINGASIFDPTLCELVYRWFCPGGGRVLDPFAGGSVRGIVAAMLGRPYLGFDLRPEQVASNEEQAKRIVGPGPGGPRWACGDSRVALADEYAVGAEGSFDFVLSCPPYGDLERYSDDPSDLSAMGWEEFVRAYREIIFLSSQLLKPDRFAVWVVGDFRDAHGNYRNFPGVTVDAFETSGLRLYNEAVLVTAVGSLPIRVSSQFPASRKLGKTHQNVHVYLKGDAKRAAAACEPATEGA